MNSSRSFVTGASLRPREFILPWSGRGINYTERDIAAVVAVMREADPLTQGIYLEQFQNIFSDYHDDGGYAFAVSSCAAALELAADLIKVEQGDEIIIPAHTYVASAIPFARRGAKIIWADIDPDFRVVTAETLERCVTSRTKAIVVVHLYGMNAPMDEIMDLAAKRDFIVIEDCAQSLGASYKEKKSGTHGHIACYSFHAQKNITTLGEGGMITFKSSEYANLLPGLRHNGHHPFPVSRECYWIPAMVNVDFDIEGVWPHNFSLGEAQCALGISLMSRLDEVNERRRRNARWLIDNLSDYTELEFQKIPNGSTHSYHLLSARYNGVETGKNRNDLIKLLAFQFKVQAVVQYYPLYRYPLFVKAGLTEARCPHTDLFFDNMVSFPFYEWYSEKQLEYLLSSIKGAVEMLRCT
jgi:dTDP-4-amino-4,6-dideoxygalactose transaminase